MDAYFGRIDRLAKGDALDSRLRFMLMDIIDMRHRNWEMRRKAEGPKKVRRRPEVHYTYAAVAIAMSSDP